MIIPRQGAVVCVGDGMPKGSMGLLEPYQARSKQHTKHCYRIDRIHMFVICDATADGHLWHDYSKVIWGTIVNTGDL